MPLKSAALSWVLEFFVGFGLGHYYAGRIGWGIFGTAASVLYWGGVAALVGTVTRDCYDGCDGQERRILTAAVAAAIGGTAWMVSWIAAPILTLGDNMRKMHRYHRPGGQPAYYGGYAPPRPPLGATIAIVPDARGGVAALPSVNFQF